MTDVEETDLIVPRIPEYTLSQPQFDMIFATAPLELKSE
jgi:hypothetical protein